MNELKPCPFCGGKAKVIRSHVCLDNKYYAVCENDNCQAAICVDSETREKAIELWNKRVSEDYEGFDDCK